MGEKLGIIVWRHASKAIYQRYINDKVINKIVEGGNREKGYGSDEADKAFDIQTGHRSQVVEAIYRRPINKSLYSTEARSAGFRWVSQEWHVFLMFDSVLRKEGRHRSRKGTLQLADIGREAVAEEKRRWTLLRQVDIQGQLEQILG
jgi:hypothetical protein